MNDICVFPAVITLITTYRSPGIGGLVAVLAQFFDDNGGVRAECLGLRQPRRPQICAGQFVILILPRANQKVNRMAAYHEYWSVSSVFSMARLT